MNERRHRQLLDSILTIVGVGAKTLNEIQAGLKLGGQKLTDDEVTQLLTELIDGRKLRHRPLKARSRHTTKAQHARVVIVYEPLSRL